VQVVDRYGERRQSHLRFVAVERRTGFERREMLAGSLLESLRDSPARLFMLLAVVNSMNVVDLLLTVVALRAGQTEGNPLMALLFSQGVAPAALFKLTVVAGVSIAIWLERRYRRVLSVALVASVALGATLLVHAVGLAFFY
jgi:hypothetical protein